MKKTILFVLTLTSFLATNMAFAAVDPTRLLIKFHRAYLSEKGDCSNPIPISPAEGGVEYDMLSNPTLASGSVPANVYKCLIIEMSDQIRFTPASTEGLCTAGTTYTLDVCRNDFGQKVKDLAGNLTSCINGEDKVFVYISNSSAGAANSNSFQPPVSINDASNGIRLQNVIDVTSGGGTFIIDGRGQVDDSNGYCDMQPPTFSFRPN